MNGVNLDQARQIARAELDRYSTDPGAVPLVITLEEEFAEGWVFHYNSARYLQNGAVADVLAGNAPLIVDRDTGQVYPTGAAFPTEHYLPSMSSANVECAKAGRSIWAAGSSPCSAPSATATDDGTPAPSSSMQPEPTRHRRGAPRSRNYWS
jgi:hypothetical protein